PAAVPRRNSAGKRAAASPRRNSTPGRARNVTPPANDAKPRSLSWRAARARDQAEAKAEQGPVCSHCSPAPTTPSAPQTCCKDQGQQPSSCQQAPTRPGGPQPEKGAQPAPGGKARGGGALSALKCQGLSTLWAVSGAVLPPAPPLAWAP